MTDLPAFLGDVAAGIAILVAVVLTIRWVRRRIAHRRRRDAAQTRPAERSIRRNFGFAGTHEAHASARWPDDTHEGAAQRKEAVS
jgi:hypothetical protein